ncbi:glycerate kinase [Pseudonocardia hispaniensis]|uniref:Glycerate kinase n=1 Tax=Pseudonocardia hispaniensis TaxID=904933 RepID=A0ABW1J9N1_9PSEU
MRVVVAPDKFKGSLTAVQAAAAMGEGVRAVMPDAEVVEIPMADGGEGTLDVLIAGGGKPVEVRVAGPVTDPVDACYAVCDGVAYVESAQACGLGYLEPTPWSALAAHTWGVGELLAHSLDQGISDIVLTVGGTASTDGGAGMLQALGCVVADAAGRRVGLGGQALTTVRAVDLTPVRRRCAGVRVRVATDVTNPLVGPSGAAAVFAPQKGAHDRDVAVLDRALHAWSRALVAAGAGRIAEIPGAGAGGGLAAGALAGFSASLVSGFDLVAELAGLGPAVARADLVVTGEGSLDAQSLAGKVPAGVARLAAARHTPVLAVAGRVRLDREALVAAGISGARALADHAPSLEHAHRHAYSLLRKETAALVRSWSAPA